MGSISKCQKLYKEQDDKQSKDRISNLPSSVIGRILSLLPTKYAVATSVLSTRWKLLWALITRLDFDDKLLKHHQRSANDSVKLSFTNFVYRVLVLHRVSYVHVFRLCCWETYDVSHVKTWVAASLVRSVQELNLSMYQTNEGTGQVLPQELFTCGTMVKLQIVAKFVSIVPTKVHMQSLKILHLDGVKFIDDDSIYRLINGCSVLDELSMQNCVGEHVRFVHIFAPVLTKLSIKPLAYSEEYERCMYEVALDCPALLFLDLDDDVEWAKGYVVKNLSHLIAVEINIGGQFSMEDREIISEIATNILMGIPSIQRLNLHRDFVLVLHECDYQLPTFRNLTSLEIEWAFYPAWDLMMRLLQKSPRLQTIGFPNGSENGDNDSWNPPQKVPTCLAVHLKVIEIEDFGGLDEELKMLEYFLKNGEVLEKVVLHGIRGVLEDVEDFKQLLRLPRGSKICQIECV